jgi:hypothetical protein
VVFLLDEALPAELTASCCSSWVSVGASMRGRGRASRVACERPGETAEGRSGFAVCERGSGARRSEVLEKALARGDRVGSSPRRLSPWLRPEEVLARGLAAQGGRGMRRPTSRCC